MYEKDVDHGLTPLGLTVLVVFLLLVLLLTAGCSTPQPLPPAEPMTVTKIVEVPVSSPCKVDVPNRPLFPDAKDALLAAPGLPERARMLAAGRVLHYEYEDRLEAALSTCVAHPTS
jgi:hypothetical protein